MPKCICHATPARPAFCAAEGATPPAPSIICHFSGNVESCARVSRVLPRRRRGRAMGNPTRAERSRCEAGEAIVRVSPWRQRAGRQTPRAAAARLCLHSPCLACACDCLYWACSASPRSAWRRPFGASHPFRFCFATRPRLHPTACPRRPRRWQLPLSVAGGVCVATSRHGERPPPPRAPALHLPPGCGNVAGAPGPERAAVPGLGSPARPPPLTIRPPPPASASRARHSAVALAAIVEFACAAGGAESCAQSWRLGLPLFYQPLSSPFPPFYPVAARQQQPTMPPSKKP